MSIFLADWKIVRWYNHSFPNHILDCTEVHGDAETIEGEGYLPIVAVENVYQKVQCIFDGYPEDESYEHFSAGEQIAAYRIGH